MFDILQEKLSQAFSSLRHKGLLTEADVDATLRELRLALLEADVALPAIRHLLAKVREQAVGEAVLKGVNPAQQVVKIVYDELVALLGAPAELELKGAKPRIILLCGLQGGGKTTTAGKLARHLAAQGQQVRLASLDVYRPAALEQLAQLGTRLNLPVLASPEQDVPRRLQGALNFGAGADVLLLDTAGRTVLDDTLMAELQTIHATAKPAATLLVADAQTGQAAVPVAEAFKAAVPLTGLILTRLDGDARGGAALSLRHITGVPILFLGTGEKPEAFEPFRPAGLAGRILGQGDVVSLVEKVQAATQDEDGAKLEEKFLKGQGLDFNDLKKQLGMLQRLGGFGSMLDLLPGLGSMKAQLADKLQGGEAERALKRQLALIDSMTPAERRNPKLLNGKRRLRIAKGAGREVAELNKLVKQLDQLNQFAKMMKGMSGGKGGGMANAARLLQGFKG